MSKKLSLGVIKESNKKYDLKERIDLDDKVHFHIYPNFAPKKISELIKEMTTDHIIAKKAGIVDFDKINTSDWGLFSILVKFSDLGIPNEINKKVQAFNELINYKHFTKMIESFPKESLEEITNRMELVTANLNKYNEQKTVNIDPEIKE